MGCQPPGPWHLAAPFSSAAVSGGPLCGQVSRLLIHLLASQALLYAFAWILYSIGSPLSYISALVAVVVAVLLPVLCLPKALTGTSVSANRHEDETSHQQPSQQKQHRAESQTSPLCFQEEARRSGAVLIPGRQRNDNERGIVGEDACLPARSQDLVGPKGCQLPLPQSANALAPFTAAAAAAPSPAAAYTAHPAGAQQQHSAIANITAASGTTALIHNGNPAAAAAATTPPPVGQPSAAAVSSCVSSFPRGPSPKFPARGVRTASSSSSGGGADGGSSGGVGSGAGSSLKAPVGLSRCTIVEDAPFPPPNTQVVMELHERVLRVGGRRLHYRGFRPADRTLPLPPPHPRMQNPPSSSPLGSAGAGGGSHLVGSGYPHAYDMQQPPRRTATDFSRDATPQQHHHHRHHHLPLQPQQQPQQQHQRDGHHAPSLHMQATNYGVTATQKQQPHPGLHHHPQQQQQQLLQQYQRDLFQHHHPDQHTGLQGGGGVVGRTQLTPHSGFLHHHLSLSIKVPWTQPTALLRHSAGGGGGGGGGLLESLNEALASGSGYMVVGAAVRAGCMLIQLDLLATTRRPRSIAAAGAGAGAGANGGGSARDRMLCNGMDAAGLPPATEMTEAEAEALSYALLSYDDAALSYDGDVGNSGDEVVRQRRCRRRRKQSVPAELAELLARHVALLVPPPPPQTTPEAGDGAAIGDIGSDSDGGPQMFISLGGSLSYAMSFNADTADWTASPSGTALSAAPTAAADMGVHAGVAAADAACGGGADGDSYTPAAPSAAGATKTVPAVPAAMWQRLGGMRGLRMRARAPAVVVPAASAAGAASKWAVLQPLLPPQCAPLGPEEPLVLTLLVDAAEGSAAALLVRELQRELVTAAMTAAPPPPCASAFCGAGQQHRQRQEGQTRGQREAQGQGQGQRQEGDHQEGDRHGGAEGWQLAANCLGRSLPVWVQQVEVLDAGKHNSGGSPRAAADGSSSDVPAAAASPCAPASTSGSATTVSITVAVSGCREALQASSCRLAGLSLELWHGMYELCQAPVMLVRGPPSSAAAASASPPGYSSPWLTPSLLPPDQDLPLLPSTAAPPAGYYASGSGTGRDVWEDVFGAIGGGGGEVHSAASAAAAIAAEFCALAAVEEEEPGFGGCSGGGDGGGPEAAAAAAEVREDVRQVFTDLGTLELYVASQATAAAAAAAVAPGMARNNASGGNGADAASYGGGDEGEGYRLPSSTAQTSLAATSLKLSPVLRPGSVDLSRELQHLLSLPNEEARQAMLLIGSNLLSYAVARAMPYTAVAVHDCLAALGCGLAEADARSAASPGAAEEVDAAAVDYFPHLRIDGVADGAAGNRMGGSDEDPDGEVDPDGSGSGGLPLMHLAVLSGSLDVVQLVLRWAAAEGLGSEWVLRRHAGLSPLQLAAAEAAAACHVRGGGASGSGGKDRGGDGSMGDGGGAGLLTAYFSQVEQLLLQWEPKPFGTMEALPLQRSGNGDMYGSGCSGHGGKAAGAFAGTAVAAVQLQVFAAEDGEGGEVAAPTEPAWEPPTPSPPKPTKQTLPQQQLQQCCGTRQQQEPLSSCAHGGAQTSAAGPAAAAAAAIGPTAAAAGAAGSADSNNRSSSSGLQAAVWHPCNVFGLACHGVLRGCEVTAASAAAAVAVVAVAVLWLILRAMMS